jgi:hypothetical protein
MVTMPNDVLGGTDDLCEAIIAVSTNGDVHENFCAAGSPSLVRV